MSEGEACRKQVVLARLGKTHGIHGWLKLHSFTSPPQNVLDYRLFEAEQAGRRFELEIDACKQHGVALIAHIKGYDSPEQARELTGALLSVSSAALPTLASGEYYWHQLEGLSVVNLQGQCLGRVDHLLETGANDVLVVSATAVSIDSKERLIPFLPDQVIRGIDLQSQTIQVAWEADYLE